MAHAGLRRRCGCHGTLGACSQGHSRPCLPGRPASKGCSTPRP
jgi:hypothetical protein